MVFGEITFDEYCSKIPEFFFKEEVPEDVIKNFEVVEKLLALSYYEYKFIDEAYAKALHTLEMAMNIRLKDFQPNIKNKSFKPLIAKLTSLNLFETNLQTLEHMEYLRNYYSHPERHSFGGAIIWNRVEFISHLINEMYEDIDLRLERRKLKREFIQKQKRTNLEKSLVMEICGKPLMIYQLQLLFINNKYDELTYLFACMPLFNYELSSDGSASVPFVFKSKLISPILADSSIEGISFSAKQIVRFSSINDYSELLSQFETWRSGYDKIEYKFQFESAMDFYYPDIYIPEIREFQKM